MCDSGRPTLHLYAQHVTVCKVCMVPADSIVCTHCMYAHTRMIFVVLGAYTLQVCEPCLPNMQPHSNKRCVVLNRSRAIITWMSDAGDASHTCLHGPRCVIGLITYTHTYTHTHRHSRVHKHTYKHAHTHKLRFCSNVTHPQAYMPHARTQARTYIHAQWSNDLHTGSYTPN